jgi:phosphoglycolate phosphatase
MNQGMEQLYEGCFGDYLTGERERHRTIEKIYDEEYRSHLAYETRLYPGIPSILAALATYGTLAVVTNKPEGPARRLLEILNVAHFMKTVVGGDTCPVAKPNPEMLDETARRTGFIRGNGHAVMIGDSAGDIKMGRAWGAKTIWCAWGYTSHPSETPDFTALTPEDLPKIVKSL